MAGEHAVAPVHNARHKVAVTVGIGHALTVNHGLRTGRHAAPHGVERGLYLADFIETYRRAGISFYAADTLAFVKVAAKLLRYYVGRHEHVAYLDYRIIIHNLQFIIHNWADVNSLIHNS